MILSSRSAHITGFANVCPRRHGCRHEVKTLNRRLQAVHVQLGASAHTYTHTHIYIYTCTRTYTHAYTHVFAHIYTRIHTYNMCIHMYIYIYMYVYAPIDKDSSASYVKQCYPASTPSVCVCNEAIKGVDKAKPDELAFRSLRYTSARTPIRDTFLHTFLP